MTLARFQTVQGRLVGLLILIAIPMAIVSAIAAITTYRTVQASVEANRAETATSYAARVETWYHGAAAVLNTATSAIAASGGGSGTCDEVARRLLDTDDSYQALRLRLAGGMECFASRSEALSPADLAPLQPSSGNGPESYGAARLGERTYLTVQTGPNSSGGQSLLVTDTAPLERTFALGTLPKGTEVNLVAQDGRTIVARQDDPAGTSDSPSSVSRQVEGSNLAVQVRQDGAAMQKARLGFLALLLLPLATLALLCAISIRAVHRHVLHWLNGIKKAAQQDQNASFAARAPVDDTMPVDIRQVAEAFNVMVEAHEQRHKALLQALDQNRLLIRELNHRVKNSLQVVQSYLALAKRDHTAEAKLALTEAECRVQVLAIAYRFALADGAMQLVRVDMFLEEVLATVSLLLRQPDQRIDSRISSQARLPIDRIIPLGLLVVEVLSRCLGAVSGVRITADVTDIGERTFEVRIVADRDVAIGPQPKLLAGLAAQIEAISHRPAAAADLGTWQVTA